MSDGKNIAISCGGDETNYYLFYTGPSGYDYNSCENIAKFAKEKFSSMKDMPDEEIMHKHIYWATDSFGYKGMYNGDTYVLFDDADKLPDDLKADAYKYCKLEDKNKGRGHEFDDMLDKSQVNDISFDR